MPAVISVTMIHAGEATNVVPDSCEIQGTVRTFTTEVLDLIEQRMQTRWPSHTCAAFEARCEFELQAQLPADHQPPGRDRRSRASVLADVVGTENVLEFEPTMGAEDFSYFLQEKPGCYFLIGNGDGSHREGGHGLGPCMLHNPSYDFNDDLIPLGATAWVRMAEQWLATPTTPTSPRRSTSRRRYAEARSKFVAAAEATGSTCSRTCTRCAAATARRLAMDVARDGAARRLSGCC
jgi:metal-dependent amidase/aminoacylase/carboxypeptidase family protein